MKKQAEFKYKLIPETQYIHLRFDHHPENVIYNIAIAELGKLALSKEHFPDRSFWVTHIAGEKPVSREWLTSFQELIQRLAPENRINWESTARYLDVKDERERLEAEYPSTSDDGIELISGLEERQKRREEINKKLAEKFDFLNG